MPSQLIYTCNNCEKIFTSIMACAGHKRIHGKPIHVNKVCCIYTRKEVAVNNLDKYQSNIVNSICNLHNCKTCNILISAKTKFCDGSCRAKFTNKNRNESGWKQSEYQKEQARSFNEIKQILSNKIIIGKYCKLLYRNCSVCDSEFRSTNKNKSCQTCRKTVRTTRKKYAFRFNVNDYPDLFDLDQILSIGWYSPAKKTNRNLNGLSKDHIVSIADAIDNGYDSYYISHPLNCKIITQSENSSKNIKSGMSYEQLKSLVDIYDANQLLNNE